MKGSCRAKTFAVFRYAEILLNYVEALNELEGSYTDKATGITVTRNTEEIKKYFNMIRYRAGMPGITDAELNSRDDMREAIKQERKVDLPSKGFATMIYAVGAMRTQLIIQRLSAGTPKPE